MSEKTFGQRYLENFKRNNNNQSIGQKYIAERRKRIEREEEEARKRRDQEMISSRIGSSEVRNPIGSIGKAPVHSTDTNKSTYAMTPETIRNNVLMNDSGKPAVRNAMAKTIGDLAGKRAYARKDESSYKPAYITKDTGTMALTGMPGIGKEVAKIQAQADMARKKAGSESQSEAIDYLEKGAKRTIAPARWQMDVDKKEPILPDRTLPISGTKKAGNELEDKFNLKLEPEKKTAKEVFEGVGKEKEDALRGYRTDIKENQIMDLYDKYRREVMSEKGNQAQAMGLTTKQMDEKYGEVAQMRYPNLPSAKKGMTFEDYVNAAVSGEKPKYGTFEEYLSDQKDFKEKSVDNSGRFSNNPLEKIWSNRNYVENVMEGGYFAESVATEEEKNYYNYLMNTGQKEEAEWYYQKIKPTLLSRAAKLLSDKVENVPGLEVAGRGMSGVAQGTLGLVNAVRSGLTDEVIDPNIYDYLDSELKQDLDSRGFLWKTAGDLVGSIGNMTPSIAASAAATALGAPEAVPAIVGATTLGASTYGNTYKEARLEGKEADESRNYAALVGASEAVLGYLLSGISAVGGKVSGNVIKSAVDSVDNVIGRVAIEMAGKMGSEFTEEYLQEVLDPVFRNICFDENNEIKPFSEEALYAGVLGALTAGILEGPGTIAGGIRTVNNGRTINNYGVDINGTSVADVLKRFGEEQEKGSLLYNLSREEKLTDGQMGILYEAYEKAYPKAAEHYLSAARLEKTLQKYNKNAEERAAKMLRKGSKTKSGGKETNVANVEEMKSRVSSYGNEALSEAVVKNYKEEFNQAEYEGFMAKYYQTGQDGISRAQLGAMLHRDPRTRSYGVDAAEEAYNAGVKELDMRHSEAQQKVVKKIAKSLGVNVEIYTADDGSNAYLDENGKIHVNMTSENPLVVAFGHELVHDIRRTNEETYSALRDIAVWQMNLYDKDGYDARFNQLKKLYEKNGKPDEDIEEEMVANAFSDFLMDESVAEKIIRQDMNFAQKILDTIKKLIRQIKKELKGYQYNSFEARALRSNMETLEEAKSLYVKGLNEVRESRKREEQEGEVEESNKKNRKASLKEKTLHERIYGDELLNAEDLITEIENVADINSNGYVTVFHRTTEENAKKIMESGKMHAKEDGIFFSTKRDGTNSVGYGNAIIELKVPVEKLVLDDIFDDEAHLRIPLKNKKEVLDVSDYLVEGDGAITDIQNPEYYSYENLIKLPDVQVGNIAGVKNKNIKKAPTDIVRDALENIKAYNDGKNNLEEKYLYNNALNRNIRIVKDSLQHTRKFKSRSHCEMILSIPTFFESMVVVNEAEGLRNKASRSYVLLGAFEDSEGIMHVVRSIVNSYDSELRVNDTQIVYSISSQKEKAKNTRWNSSQKGAYPDINLASSYITVSDLLEKVKETTYKNILPEDVLIKFGLERGTEDTIEGLKHSLKESGSAYLEEEHIAESIEKIEEGLGITGGEMPTEKEVHKMAQKIIERYESSYDVDKLAWDISKALTEMETASAKEIVENLSAAIKPALMESARMDYTLRNNYQEMLDFFSGEGIALTEEEKSEWEQAEGKSFESIRKTNMGRLLLKKNGTSLSSVWEELCSEYPEFFDREAEGAERIMQVLDAIDAVQPRLKSEVGYDLNKTATDRAIRVLADYFDLGSVKKAYGEAVKGVSGEIKAEVNKYRNNSGQNFNRSMRTIRQRALRVGEVYAENAELQKQIREGMATARVNERTKMREVMERRKHRDGIRRNAKTLTNWMENPTTTRHVPDGLRGAVVELLASIDYLSNRADLESKESIGWTERMRKLENMLEQYTKNGTNDFDALGDIDPNLPEKIEAIASKYEGKKMKLSDMTTEELRELSEIVNGVRKGVTESNDLRANKLAEKVNILGDMTVSELKEKKEGNATGIKKMADFDLLDPIRVFERMGKAAKSIFDELQEGFNKRTKLMEEAMEYAKPVLEGVDIEKLEKEMTTIKLGDKYVRLSKAHIMSLYLYGKRKESRFHLEKGGFKVEEMKGARLDGKKYGKDIKQSEYYRISEAQITMLANTYLTEEERGIADRLQYFMATNCARWGNEVSQILYEYDKYLDEDYIPMFVDDSANKTNNRTVSETSLNRVANYGFTKKLQNKAKKPLVIHSLFDVFTRHVVEMANHNAYTIPVNDAMKWINYQTVEAVNEGDIYVEDPEVDHDGVKHQLERVYGRTAQKYITDLIKDINGESVNMGTDMGINKLISNFKVASVAANLRVVVQQPTAIMRVMDIIDPKYVLQAGRKDGVSGGEKARKYCSLAKWKSWGFFDTGLNTGLKNVLTGQGSMKEKIQEKALWAAGKADDVTWGIIWNICEAEQRDKTGLSGEELYKKTAERMTEVCAKTQVVDSVLTKSAALRSKNQLVKAEMTFQSEANKSLNMLLDTVYAVRSGDKNGYKKVARGVGVFLANALVNAAAQSLIDAGRDDDETKKWLEIYAESFKENAFDNAGVWNMIPYVKDVVSIASGYGADRNELVALNNLVLGGQKIEKWMNDKEYREEHSLYQTFYPFIQGLSQLFGVPVSAAMREIVVHSNMIARAVSGKNLIQTKSYTYTDKYTRIVQAMEKGDTETVNELKKWLREHGRDEKTIQRGIANARKKLEEN